MKKDTGSLQGEGVIKLLFVLPKKYGAEELIYESAHCQAFQRPTAALHRGKVRTAHKFWWTMAS